MPDDAFIEDVIHSLTIDLLTARGEVYQVALPPNTKMGAEDVLRHLTGVGSMALRNRRSERVTLEGDNLVMRVTSHPHDADRTRIVWFYDW